MIDADKQKPCIALMGEFSAGKSTLANLLIGYDPLPVQVIATQLPPVRIVHGEGDPFQVTLDGQTSPIDLESLDKTSLKETAFIQIYSQEDFLEHCDLIDMPGISDPNMPSEVWERMIGEAHGVIWCSPATQAWRQSEAAVWASLPSDLYQTSILLLTRMDKLTSQADKERVISRVRQETQGLFADVLPISLLLATREQENYALWQESGAEALAKSLISILQEINSDKHAQSLGEVKLRALEAPGSMTAETDRTDTSEDRVLPRRPVASGNRTPRPSRDRYVVPLRDRAAPHIRTDLTGE